MIWAAWAPYTSRRSLVCSDVSAAGWAAESSTASATSLLEVDLLVDEGSDGPEPGAYRGRQCDIGVSLTFQLLLDDLVRPRQHRRRDREVEGLRGFEVDDQLERRRLQHGQIGGLGALQDLASVEAGLPIRVHQAGCVAHQATSLDEFTK